MVFQIKGCGIDSIVSSSRYLREEGGTFYVFSRNKACKLRQSNKDIIVCCEDGYMLYWLFHFGLVSLNERDLFVPTEEPFKSYGDKYIVYDCGYRLMNTYSFEDAVIRIILESGYTSDHIEKLCERFGSKNYWGIDYHAFPTPRQLSCSQLSSWCMQNRIDGVSHLIECLCDKVLKDTNTLYFLGLLVSDPFSVFADYIIS